MSIQQLTLDNNKFNVTGRKKINWAKPPSPNSDKLTFYRAIVNDKSPIYDLIEKVAPDISSMYPEMNGIVLGLRVKPMTWCAACWDYHRDEIDFDVKENWTEKEIGATLAHELTHAYHSKIKAIPGGEKATDVFMLSRVPIKYVVHPCYLECAKEPFELYPERMQELAKQAIVNRNNGVRQYIQWFEDQVNKIYYDLKGEPMPKRTRFSYAAWRKNNLVEEQAIVHKNPEREHAVLLILMELEKQAIPVLKENLFSEVEVKYQISKDETKKSLMVLMREGDVYEPMEGYVRKV